MLLRPTSNENVAQATYHARENNGEQQKKARRKNTVKTGVSRETWYIFLSKKIRDRVVDDINNVDHRRCEGVVWLELSSIKERHVIPLAAYTVKREIGVLGQGRARHGRLGRCQTREFESKPLLEGFRRASFGGKVQNRPKNSRVI